MPKHCCGLRAGASQLHSACIVGCDRARCGLRAGASQLHFPRVNAPRKRSCGLRAGASQLHCLAGNAALTQRCGLRAGASQLHSGSIFTHRIRRCGLRAGASQLHYPRPQGAENTGENGSCVRPKVTVFSRSSPASLILKTFPPVLELILAPIGDGPKTPASFQTENQ